MMFHHAAGPMYHHTLQLLHLTALPGQLAATCLLAVACGSGLLARRIARSGG
jgi:2-polyprenyl-3-methyl-5-hydroxy-6-metoxy-1,4-benzoquinol methylase